MRFLEPLVGAPRWQKLVLGVIALAALGGAGYVLAVSGLESRVAALRVRRDLQRDEIARARTTAADLPRFGREAADVERRLEAAKEKLPGEHEMPALYRALSDAAIQAGLAVTLFQPQGPRVGEFYSEIPIALVAEGGYHDVGEFVGRVAALPRTTTIGAFKLIGAATAAARPGSSGVPGLPAMLHAPRGDGRALDPASTPRHSLRAEMTLFTYVYRPVGSPPPPKPPGAAPSKPEAPRS